MRTRAEKGLRLPRCQGIDLAVNEQRSNYELLAKVTGELDDRPQVTVNIQQSAAFIAVRSVIFEVLEPHPDLRREISRRLTLLADSSDTEAS